MDFHCYCPELTGEDFSALDLRETDLSGKTFYVSKIPVISHFPMNPELKTEKVLQEIEKKGFRTVSPLFVIFEDGLFMGRIMVEIVKPSVKDSNVETINDLKLIGKTFTGPKYLVPKALKQFDSYLMSKRHLTTKFYFWYHSCPKCEKEKGIRTVIFGKIK